MSHAGYISPVDKDTNLIKVDEVGGSEIGDGFKLNIDFEISNRILVSVDQSYADSRLSLINRNTNEVFTTVDFSAYLGFPELLLVETTNCQNCSLLIEGVSELDRKSAFNIKLYAIDVSASDVYLTALRSISESGAANHIAESVDGEYQQQLRIAASFLESLLNVELQEHEQWIDQHSKSFLAYMYYYLEKPDKGIEILSELSAGKDQNIYYVQALYELASTYETDVQKILGLLADGIEISKQIGHQQAVVQGLKYRAIRHVRNTNFDQAYSDLRAAETLNSSRINFRAHFDILYNFAWASIRLGKFDEGLKYASQLRYLAKQFNAEENELWSLYLLGMAYVNLGDMEAAGNFLGTALQRLEELPLSSRSYYQRLNVYLNLEQGFRYKELGLYVDALESVNKARAQAEIISMNERLSDIPTMLGDLESLQGNYKKAADYFSVALKDSTSRNDHQSSVRYLIQLAQISRDSARKTDALSYLNLALKKSEALTLDPSVQSKLFLTNLSLLNSLEYLEEAAELIEVGKELYKKPVILSDKVKFLYEAAKTSNMQGQYELARKALESAENVLDDLLEKTIKLSERRSLLAINKSIYELQIHTVSQSSKRPARATLEVAERFRARTLKEQLRQLSFNVRLDKPVLIAERDAVLRSLVSKARTLHLEESPIIEARVLSKKLEDIEVELGSYHLDEIAKGSDSSASDSLELKDSEYALSYFIGENNSWAWIVSEHDIEMYSLKSAKELAPFVDDYMALLTQPPAARTQGFWEQNKVISRLSTELLAPLASHAKNSKISDLLIVSDGLLDGVPFAPLVIDESGEALIEKFNISHSPSLAANKGDVKSFKQAKISKNAKALLVAASEGDSRYEKRVLSLPNSKKEVNLINAIMPESSIVLSDQQANKKQISNALKGDISIFHLAAHGLVSWREPNLSGFLIGTESSAERLWLAPEISRLKHSAQLVVLSSCESAQGKRIEGEGLLSLSRAFIESGASNVIGSLWKVDDESTQILMSEFYNTLILEEKPINEALNHAQRAILRDGDGSWNDPYYWAAFQLIGV